MKLSSFKTLQLKDPRTAMIFDLTERFPRGPKAKLRSKHYETKNAWGENLHVPTSDELIGGDLGYDLFELYELCKRSWWNDDLLNLTVDTRDCAMGDQHYCRQTYTYIEGSGHCSSVALRLLVDCVASSSASAKSVRWLRRRARPTSTRSALVTCASR